ncbi:hypothetical protein CABS02_14426 [Colletotrichum abscissum]|uniref:Uncharacterized protein n=1 Tax=Colletotrichum abscissum TaxID=1671311 RepID=A0A9Q0AW53_9PEZI|nr:hypothetical protein CABS02_14426 [Colletotrichum abscissum]
MPKRSLMGLRELDSRDWPALSRSGLKLRLRLGIHDITPLNKVRAQGAKHFVGPSYGFQNIPRPRCGRPHYAKPADGVYSTKARKKLRRHTYRARQLTFEVLRSCGFGPADAAANKHPSRPAVLFRTPRVALFFVVSPLKPGPDGDVGVPRRRLSVANRLQPHLFPGVQGCTRPTATFPSGAQQTKLTANDWWSAFASAQWRTPYNAGFSRDRNVIGRLSTSVTEAGVPANKIGAATDQAMNI